MRVETPQHLAGGLLRCGLCDRPLRTVPSRYVCVPECPHPGVAAGPVDRDLLLRTLVRAYVALHQVGRTDASRPPGAVFDIAVSRDEIMRWQWCDPSDRAAMLRTAFNRVVVDVSGQLRPVWRHSAEADGERR